MLWPLTKDLFVLRQYDAPINLGLRRRGAAICTPFGRPPNPAYCGTIVSVAFHHDGQSATTPDAHRMEMIASRR